MNRRFTSFLLVLSVCCVSFQVLGQEMTSDSIRSLEWMVGKWNITASLEDSNGSVIEESGFKECSWVLGNRVIRCDSFIRNDQTSVENKWQFRSVITYIAFDKANGNYKITWIRPDGNHTSVVFNREKGSVLRSAYVYKPPSLGFDMHIKTSWTMIDFNQFKELEILKNKDGTFSEKYEVTATRIQ